MEESNYLVVEPGRLWYSQNEAARFALRVVSLAGVCQPIRHIVPVLSYSGRHGEAPETDDPREAKWARLQVVKDSGGDIVGVMIPSGLQAGVYQLRVSARTQDGLGVGEVHGQGEVSILHADAHDSLWAMARDEATLDQEAIDSSISLLEGVRELLESGLSDRGDWHDPGVVWSFRDWTEVRGRAPGISVPRGILTWAASILVERALDRLVWGGDLEVEVDVLPNEIALKIIAKPSIHLNDGIEWKKALRSFMRAPPSHWKAEFEIDSVGRSELSVHFQYGKDSPSRTMRPLGRRRSPERVPA